MFIKNIRDSSEENGNVTVIIANESGNGEECLILSLGAYKRMAKQLGYKTVFWSLAYVDWNNDSRPTREYAFSKLLPRIHNGAVVLLHSTSSTNAQILDELLTRWKDMGYTFASVDGLFKGTVD